MQLVNLSMPLEGLASSRGFQPQNKPPVHTGGFDYLKTSYIFPYSKRQHLILIGNLRITDFLDDSFIAGFDIRISLYKIFIIDDLQSRTVRAHC